MCFRKVSFSSPFSDVEFAGASAARDAKRRPTKRKSSAGALTSDLYTQIVHIWDENEPVDLQRKFFHIISRELAWTSGEGFTAKVVHFIK